MWKVYKDCPLHKVKNSWEIDFITFTIRELSQDTGRHWELGSILVQGKKILLEITPLQRRGTLWELKKRIDFALTPSSINFIKSLNSKSR